MFKLKVAFGNKEHTNKTKSGFGEISNVNTWMMMVAGQVAIE